MCQTEQKRGLRANLGASIAASSAWVIRPRASAALGSTPNEGVAVNNRSTRVRSKNLSEWRSNREHAGSVHLHFRYRNRGKRQPF
jgi:hypothetical protein